MLPQNEAPPLLPMVTTVVSHCPPLFCSLASVRRKQGGTSNIYPVRVALTVSACVPDLRPTFFQSDGSDPFGSSPFDLGFKSKRGNKIVHCRIPIERFLSAAELNSGLITGSVG